MNFQFKLTICAPRGLVRGAVMPVFDPTLHRAYPLARCLEMYSPRAVESLGCRAGTDENSSWRMAPMEMIGRLRRRDPPGNRIFGSKRCYWR